MRQTGRGWRQLVGCTAAGVAGVLAASGVATAEPVLPSPPTPVYPPVTAPQAVTPQAVTPHGVAPHAVGAAPTASAPAADPAVAPVPGAAPATPPARLPASSGTLRDYFAEKGVQLEPQQPDGFTALNITLPMPPGWTRVPDPNVPDAFAVIADRRTGALYTPNAQVVVYRLVGHFDAAEAITHGFIDSQQLPAWRTTNASLADFGGFPSSVIEGTYRQDDLTLNTSQRHVIAGSAANSYLVSLTVTTGVGETVGNAPATDAIVNGFRVAVPGAGPAAPPASTPPDHPALPAPSPARPATASGSRG